MAIAKVALAGTALVVDGTVHEIRLAAASLAPFPVRLKRVEDAVCGKAVDARLIQSACSALLAEVRPIDDIRSTAEYRSQVAANLLEEFLSTIEAPERS
jgi:CO/xanthine dehydrogenase FAD-binding subunit